MGVFLPPLPLLYCFFRCSSLIPTFTSFGIRLKKATSINGITTQAQCAHLNVGESVAVGEI